MCEKMHILFICTTPRTDVRFPWHYSRRRIQTTEWPYPFLVQFEKQMRKNISEVDKEKGEKAFPLLFGTGLGQNPCSKTRENMTWL